MAVSAPQGFRAINAGFDPTGATLTSFNRPTGQTDAMLYASLRCLYSSTPPVTTFTRNGNALTKVRAEEDTHGNGNVGSVDLWYLDDADFTVGSFDLTASFGVAIFECSLSAWWVSGVNQGAPDANAGANSDLTSPCSVNITPLSANSLVQDVAWITDGSGSAGTLSPTKTLIGEINVAVADNVWSTAASYVIPTGTTQQTMQWSWTVGTQNQQGQVAAVWPEASVAPTGVPKQSSYYHMMGMR